MTRESLKLRCVFIEKTVKEIVAEVNERGIVRTSDVEVNKVKAMTRADMTPRHRRIWDEVDIVTSKWMNEKRRRVVDECANIMRRYGVIDDDYDEYLLRVIMCEDGFVFVYDENGDYIALVNLERGAVVLKNGKKEK